MCLITSSIAKPFSPASPLISEMRLKYPPTPVINNTKAAHHNATGGQSPQSHSLGLRPQNQQVWVSILPAQRALHRKELPFTDCKSHCFRPVLCSPLAPIKLHTDTIQPLPQVFHGLLSPLLLLPQKHSTGYAGAYRSSMQQHCQDHSPIRDSVLIRGASTTYWSTTATAASTNAAAVDTNDSETSTSTSCRSFTTVAPKPLLQAASRKTCWTLVPHANRLHVNPTSGSNCSSVHFKHQYKSYHHHTTY